MGKAAENHHGLAQAHLGLVDYQGSGIEKTGVKRWNGLNNLLKS
jgi:hypothetical protein